MSQNLFEFCQLTVSSGINWNKTALEEITNNLQFKVKCLDPLTLTREGLSEEIFLRLIETLRKCSTPGTQSEDWEFISSQFANLKIKDNSEQVKKDLPVVSDLPSISSNNKTTLNLLERNINTTPSKETDNLHFGETKTDCVTLRHDHSLYKAIDENCREVFKEQPNAYDLEHVPVSEAKIGFLQLESSSDINAQAISFDDDFCESSQGLDHRGEDIKDTASKSTLNYCQETKKPGQTDQSDSVNFSLKYKVLTGGENIIISKCLNYDIRNVAELNCPTIETEIQNHGELNDKEENEMNTNNVSDKVVQDVSLKHKIESGEASLGDIEVKEIASKNQNRSSKNMSQETTEKILVKSNASRKDKKDIKSPNDGLQDKQHILKEMVTTDQTNASEEYTSTREVKQRSLKQFNQDEDDYKTGDFNSSLKNFQPNVPISEGASSELEKNVQFLFNEIDFEAVRYYFQDHNHSLQKCLDEAKLKHNKYVLEFNEREVSKDDYETLKSFKTSCFDKVEEIQALKWEKSIKIKQQKIKTLFKSEEKLFYIIGPKDEVRAATSMILTFRGNNDDELMWQKVPEETKDTSSNSIRSQKQNHSSDTAKLVSDKCNNQRDRHIDSSSKKSCDETKQDKMMTTKSSKLKKDERQVSSFKLSGLKVEKFQEKSFRRIEQNRKGPIYLGNNLRVNICNDDITKLDVEMIVNAANIHLKHNGGVALAIAKAAGSQLQEECDDFIHKNKALEVTGVFVSSGGNLKARKIIHAVGPKWDYYKDKNKCLEDLRHTILRCLVEASRLNAQNITLPSISAAIFRVPPELCAKNYMAAVKHFDCIREELNLTSLEEIMFVDVNDDLVNTIQEEFHTHWKDDPDENLLKQDLDFAKQHLNNPTPTANNLSQDAGDKPKELRQSLSSSGKMGAKATEKGQTYFYESLKISVSVKPALISANEVVIVVGEPFKNISGAEDFDVKKHLQEDKKESVWNNKEITVFRSLYNSNSSSRVRHVYCLHCDTSSKEEMEKALLYLTSMDWSSLSDQKQFTLVITSKIFFNAKKNSDFKLVKTLADLLHKYIPETSTNTILKGIRIATSEDALPNIIKVFDSRKDLKPAEKATERNWKTNQPNSRESYSGRQDDQHKSSATGNGASRQTSEYINSARNHPTSNYYAQGGSSVDMETLCMKCRHKNSFHSLPCCSRRMCSDCFENCAICPFCGALFRILTGNQPEGEMSVHYVIYPHVSTYPQLGAWQITYHFQSGLQKENHPNPGKQYTGLTRSAFLPDTTEGYYMLIRLKIAFMRGLTFTIGTQNMENRILWNGIHHKTSLYGGRSNNGYPDSAYLMRLEQELRERGVIFETVSQIEKPEIRIFVQALQLERSRPLLLQTPVYF